ncbi:radical SAM protein [Candidatus Fermentibacteria bacterium]|nr:radical SAM protein [Candidatus Fermentibacteria bacterium]
MTATRPWIVFELTPRCNLHCLYCCNPWTLGGQIPPGELETVVMADLMRKIAVEVNPLGITLSGGEPLVRADIMDLAAEAVKLFPDVSIATNGLLLTRSMAKDLAALGVRSVQISIPAATDDTFEELCGARALDRGLAGMAAASGAGLSVCAAFTLTALNAEQCSQVLEKAFAFGASSFQINRLARGGRAAAGWRELVPGRDQVCSAVSEVSSNGDLLGLQVFTGIPLEPCLWPAELLEGLTNEGCLCADAKWAIDPEGHLRPCEQSSLVLGNLLERDFDQLAEGPLARRFRREYRSPECLDCPRISTCRGGCRAMK